ncbi:hypothetical protein ACJMK2_039242, partial [Sinanodonta woodiana]
MGQASGKKHTGSFSRIHGRDSVSNYSQSQSDTTDNIGFGKQEKNKKMPLLRKQSDQAKKKSQYQQYLAQESPEPIFDLSGCELGEVPSGVFALCKVLQKEVLLLNDNWLQSLTEGGKLSDLRTIRVLDLHNNELKSLPDEICFLESLQVLNLENNQLAQLPDTFGQLQALQTLNVKGNRLKNLPQSLFGLNCLRMLDISNNRVTIVPKQLCKVRTLEMISLDASNMEYPDKRICSMGTEEVMKFLSSESGVEYFPPSNFLHNILDPPRSLPTSPSQKAIKKASEEEGNLMRTLADYSQMMEKKRIERLELERLWAEDQQDQALLAMIASNNRQKLIDAIAQEEDRLDRELVELTHRKDIEKIHLLQNLHEVEQSAADLIQRILVMNEKARKTDDLLDNIEKERIEKEDLFVVRWEEIQNLRKKEVLEAMQKVLQESEIFEKLRLSYTDRRDSATLRQTLVEEEMLASSQVECVLHHKKRGQEFIAEQLAIEDKLQKEAFEVLQLQKDVKHHRITAQISLIEEELVQLTTIEIQRRELRTEDEINRLAEKRIQLIEILTSLLYEQEKRQKELRKRLQEMEQQREDGQIDYWLVQYQRLMDRKPQTLIDQENQLEIAVVKILEQSGASDYIPLFAHNRISIETLLQLSDEDLKQMGIHEHGIRNKILQHVDRHSEQHPPPKVLPSENEEPTKRLEPSAPPVEESPTRQTSILARGMNSECSICLDNPSAVIFLTCGHVCCCVDCSHQVQQCPLCRSEIVQCIRLIAPP